MRRIWDWLRFRAITVLAGRSPVVRNLRVDRGIVWWTKDEESMDITNCIFVNFERGDIR